MWNFVTCIQHYKAQCSPEFFIQKLARVRRAPQQAQLFFFTFTMFKKPFKLGPASLLKKSDQRRFRDSLKVENPFTGSIKSLKIHKYFQAAFSSLTDERLSLVVALKDEVTVRRVTDSYIQIYFAQNEPIFVDTTGKNEFCPTGIFSF